MWMVCVRWPFTKKNNEGCFDWRRKVNNFREKERSSCSAHNSDDSRLKRSGKCYFSPEDSHVKSELPVRMSQGGNKERCPVLTWTLHQSANTTWSDFTECQRQANFIPLISQHNGDKTQLHGSVWGVCACMYCMYCVCLLCNTRFAIH